MRNGWISRVLSWIAAALVGGVFGLAGTIAHSFSWGVLPIGLIVGAIACGAILVAVRSLGHDRAAAIAAGLGMIVMVMVISGEGPGGSVVVQDTLSGRIWTYLVAGLVLLVVAWPSLGATRSATTAPAASPEPPRDIAAIAGGIAIDDAPPRGERTADGS